MEIKDIYRVNYMKDRFSFIGTLRNEKRFNINDNVFFALSKYANEIFRGKIIGVELSISDNPEYQYKIEIPERFCQPRNIPKSNSPTPQKRTFENIICDSIFTTPEEAKESAEKNLIKMAKFQKKEINRYFRQFIREETGC